MLDLTPIRSRPDLKIVEKKEKPVRIDIRTHYGTIVLLDNELDAVYINGMRYNVNDKSQEGFMKLFGSFDDVSSQLVETLGRRATGRATRITANKATYEEAQERVFKLLSNTDLNFETLQRVLAQYTYGVRDFDYYRFQDELSENQVQTEDLAEFIAYKSDQSKMLVSLIHGSGFESEPVRYNFRPVNVDRNPLVKQFLERIGETSAEYDRRNAVLKVADRMVFNFPTVDEWGVFHKRNRSFIPHYVGYFSDTPEDNGKSRVERLRVFDPVERAMDGAVWGWQLSDLNIEFPALIDVTRDFVDFDKHPYAEEVAHTLRRKVVIHKDYSDTHNFLKKVTAPPLSKSKMEDMTQEELEKYERDKVIEGFETIMLDPEARRLIDPTVTSNGENFGRVFYLTSDAVVNPDGTLSKGERYYSMVGDVLMEHSADFDNMNRNQMSGNMLLSSKDVKSMNAAFCEAGLFNADDACILTKKGAEKLGVRIGDKLSDFHGNKHVVSIIVTPNGEVEYQSIDPSSVLESGETFECPQDLIDLVTMNPDLDMIVSPLAITSRMNMGAMHEVTSGAKQDLYLPNGEMIDNGIVEIDYMKLKQTAENKSVDYGEEKEGEGRKFSTYYRHALAGKIGYDMYEKAFLTPEVVYGNKKAVITAFERCGLSFIDNNKLAAVGNINSFVDNESTIDANDLFSNSVQAIRDKVYEALKNDRCSILLGDMFVINPLTGDKITDSAGRNILPISQTRTRDKNRPSSMRLEDLSLRYHSVFKALSVQNSAELQKAYSTFVEHEYKQLTKKDNVLKNVETVQIKMGTRTMLIVPDPTLEIGQVRLPNSSETRLLIHRDPCLHSSNVIAVENVGGGYENVLMVSPELMAQISGDFDSDTMGVIEFKQLAGLTAEEKDLVFETCRPENQLNHYGSVLSSVASGHFKALVKANGLEDLYSRITFENGESQEEVAKLINDLRKQIIDSPESYGAYALSFTDERTVTDSLCRIAEDGIKGNADRIREVMARGYTDRENLLVGEAMLAKSQMTGVAGAVTNGLFATLGQIKRHDLMRLGSDITEFFTQRVLQMKNNADGLQALHADIRKVNQVFDGNFGNKDARKILHDATRGSGLEQAVDQFCDKIIDYQRELSKTNNHINTYTFGHGILHGHDASHTDLAFASGKAFKDLLDDMIVVPEQDNSQLMLL